MDTEFSIARVVLSLAIVLGMIGLSAWVLKWFSDKSLVMRQMGSDKRLKVIETAMLDPKHKCFIVACDDKEYVAISNGNSIEVLDSKDKKEARSA